MSNGKIDSYNGIQMNMKEEFICNYCGTNFKVNGRVTFQTEENVKKNFAKDYTSKVKKALFLDEE